MLLITTFHSLAASSRLVKRSGHTPIIHLGVVGTGYEVTEDYIRVSISLTRAKVTTIKFRAGSPKLEVLVIATTRTLLLKIS